MDTITKYAKDELRHQFSKMLTAIGTFDCNPLLRSKESLARKRNEALYRLGLVQFIILLDFFTQKFISA